MNQSEIRLVFKSIVKLVCVMPEAVLLFVAPLLDPTKNTLPIADDPRLLHSPSYATGPN